MRELLSILCGFSRGLRREKRLNFPRSKPQAVDGGFFRSFASISLFPKRAFSGASRPFSEDATRLSGDSTALSEDATRLSEAATALSGDSTTLSGDKYWLSGEKYRLSGDAHWNPEAIFSDFHSPRRAIFILIC